jgi:hypothetical protein
MEYRLDLNTLLLMLKQSTGSLHSESQRLAGIKGRCQVFLRLERGVIQACFIKNERGIEVERGEAAVKLIQNEVLLWHYQEEQPPPSPVAPEEVYPASSHRPREAPPRSDFSLVVRSPVPSRTYPSIPHHEFLHWPRLYRAVYSLIDGKTSVDDIVRLLAREQTKERVLEVIAHLQREGLIVFNKGFTGKL